MNDVSERAWQLQRGGSWSKGKSFDGFGEIGPWLVTTDEIANPHDLTLELQVDGEIMQSSSTCQMIFKVADLVAYVSAFMTLWPGDIIATGTPGGVGEAMKPKRYLTSGDVVEVQAGGEGFEGSLRLLGINLLAVRGHGTGAAPLRLRVLETAPPAPVQVTDRTRIELRDEG
jgi:2,4-didehydro-3-deoxy-L-rhamnonate hydrolase